MVTVPGIIARRNPITGPDNPGFQVSADEWNRPLVLDSDAVDGALIVRDRTQPDGWGFAEALPDTIGVPATRKVNNHALVTDIWLTPADLGLDQVENTKLSTWGGANSIATVGIITQGEWRGAVIQAPYGGTGTPFARFTGPLALHTYMLPDMDAVLFSTAAPVPIAYGGTGVTTGLTQLDATNLTSGIVPDARLSGNVARRDQPNNIPWTAVSKSGSSLAQLETRSASDLTTGTLDPARLPPGVPSGPVDLASGVVGRLPFSNLQAVSANVLLGRGNTPGDVQQLFIGTGIQVVGATVSVPVVTTALPGLVPTLPNSAALVLNGVGVWAAPPPGPQGPAGPKGEVGGPASATLNAIALFADTTGKVIKDSAVLLTSLARVDAPNTFVGNQLVSKSVPEVQLLHTGATAKTRLLQHAVDVSTLTTNLSRTSSWNLDDTAQGGIEYEQSSNPFGIGPYALWSSATPGVNPRTVSVLMYVAASAGLTIPVQARLLAQSASQQTVPSGAWTQVAFGTVLTNVLFTQTSPTLYTAKATGHYFISTTVTFDPSNQGQRGLGISKNGSNAHTPEVIGFAAANAGYDVTLSATICLALNANDTIEVHAFQSSGADLVTGGRASYLSIVKLA